MRPARNTVLIAAAALAGIILFINPLQYLRGNAGGVSRPAADTAVVASLLSYADSHWRSPEDYVVSSFESHDVVFLGEFFKIRQNVQLVQALIPRLYKAGVRNLGIEYALSDDQAEIDALVTGPAWDEARACAITFDWLVTWGYQEYIDLYKAAWQLNHGLPRGAKPFRVVGLNVRQYWEFLKTNKDLGDPQVVARIFAGGVPDGHMADVIDREFLQRREKALVYCGTQHIFTRYRSGEYEKNAAAMKLPEIRRAGNIIHEKIGARAFSISMHAPWPDKNQKNGLAYPAEGVIDALIIALPADKRNAGWDTAGTPLGALPVRTGSYPEGAAGMTLADLFDGYIIQGPIAEYTTVTPIKDFVRPEDADQAARNFPGVKTTPPTVAQVNQAIQDDVQAVGRLLAPFK
ncbi:MAG TPA: hypothetical protein VFB30_12680 [Spirochaetia bacterium]|nr:hypothetical protein [Spirochaetia bacterium]